MIDKIAFCSVAFGDQRYVSQIEKLGASISNIYENPNLLFWIDSLPENSKSHLDSLYGFKVWAVQNAINRGFKKVIWLDPAMILVKRELEYYDDILKENPVIAIQDDNLLINHINNKCKNYFSIDDNWLNDIDAHLIGGSFYYFDFENELANKIFEEWKHSEINGVFGSAKEDIGSHRNDETCLSVCLYKNKKQPISYTGSRYNWDGNPIFIKEHFK